MKKTILTIFSLAICSSVFCQVPSTGLVAYFPFDGNANDSSVNGTDGTLHNVSLTKDRFGNDNSAYSFAGNTSSYIDFAGTNLKNNKYSYSLWANVETLSNGSLGFALAVGDGTGAQGQSINAANNYLSSYNGWQAGGYSTSAPHLSIYSDTVPTFKKWYHIAAVRNNNYILLYLNGKLIDSSGVSSTTNPAYGSTTKGYIGIRDDISSPFKGAIDDVCIYNRVLTKEEVTQLYSIKKPTSIATVKPKTKISFYPNPNLGTVKLANTSVQLTKLELFSLDGKLIYTQKINNTDLIQLPVQIANGTYLIKFHGSKNENIEIQRISVLREN